MFLDRLFSSVTRRDDPGRSTRGYLPSTQPAGVAVTMETAMQFSAVWACIDAIMKAISSCRWEVLDYDQNDRQRKRYDDPVDYLLNTRPNPETTAIALREALMISALSWGNGYLEIVPNRLGQPAELYFMDPDRTTPRRDAIGALFYEYIQPDGGIARLEPAQVFHLRGPSVTGLMGDNMIARASRSIALALAAERYASTYYGNNTVLGGVIEYPQTLSEAAMKTLRETWGERHGGPGRAHGVAVLDRGAKFSQFAADAEKAQVVESRKFQIEEIARYFGVPLHKIQHLEHATFSNIEAQGISFVRDALTPWAIRLQQEADFKFFGGRLGRNRETRLDMGWLLGGDAQSRAQADAVWRNIGVLSVNEIREREGLNNIGPDGDVRITMSNMVPLEQLGKVPVAGAPAPQREHDDPDDDPQAMIRETVLAMFEGSLERHARRLQNRREDLARHKTPSRELEANLAREERRSLDRIATECGAALRVAEKLGGGAGGALALLFEEAQRITRGAAQPREAASRLVSSLLPLPPEARA